MRSSSVHRVAFFLAIALLIVIGLVIFFPPIRTTLVTALGIQPATTREVTQTTIISSATISFHSPSTIVGSTPTPTPTAVLIGTQGLSSNSEILRVSDRLGWKVAIPTHLPEGYHSGSVYLDPVNQLVTLSFFATRQLPGSDLTETKSMTLVEATQNDIVPLVISPQSTATAITVNSTTASYILGAWETTFVSNPSEANGGHMESNWRNDLPLQNIYWQVGKVYLVLITDDPLVTQADLIKMAGSIK